MQKCLTCHGKGKIGGGCYIANKMLTCPTCKGLGYMVNNKEEIAIISCMFLVLMTALFCVHAFIK